MGNPTNEGQNPNGQDQNETDDEIREKVIDELGVDPDDNEELVERLVEREKQHKEQLGKAIKQKIKYRKKAKSKSQKDQDDQGDTRSGTNQGNTPDIEQLVESKVKEVQENQTLQSMDLPDEVKKEVKELAQFKGISVEEAANHDYIQNMAERVRSERRVKKATPKRSNKGSYTSKVDPSKPLNPDDFDMDTEEGVEAWQKARDARKSWKKNNS